MAAEKNSILIVDDDKINLLVLIAILEESYTLYTAKDGEEAIFKAKKYIPDLILLDIVLPNMDGYEVFTRLRDSSAQAVGASNIPVIFISALSESSDEEKGLELGAVDYITKPFSPAVVKIKVMHQIKIVNLQRDLEKAALSAKKANQAKSAFLANMSHEMRTPMNVIVGLSDLLLEEENIPGKTKETLTKINSAGNTLVRLFSDMLDISKAGAGKLHLMPVQYDMASFLDDIIALNTIRIEEKPITFMLDIDRDLPYSLFGDDLRVKQVLNNLLSNAFNYTEKGTVTLGINCQWEDANVWVSFYVSDTGIGIREEDIAKLFTNYNQVDTSAHRANEGMGLGLNITKKFVELMDGEISVESEYGKGSTFRVRIRQGFVNDRQLDKETIENLRNYRYADKKESHEKLVRPDLGYAKVLVVDDFPVNLDITVGMLRKYNMRVDCVLSGQDAVDSIVAGEPVYNAVFMDHMMPGMDGIEATKAIRALGTKYTENLPIIALTANAVIGNEQMFLDNGFNGYLPKPFNVMELDAIVQRWVKKQ